METCLDILNGIESLRPSSTEFSWATRSKWAWEVCRQVYHDIGVYKYVDYRISTTVNAIDLTTASTQIKIENVKKLWVTANKTTISSNITSTSVLDEYKIESIVDPANVNTIKFNTYFPDERMLRIQFLAYPALFPATSTDSSSIPDIDQEGINAIKYGTMVKICKAGDAPDVQLANAYEADFQEELKRVKVLLKNKNRKLQHPSVSYKEWNW